LYMRPSMFSVLAPKEAEDGDQENRNRTGMWFGGIALKRDLGQEENLGDGTADVRATLGINPSNAL